MRGFTSLESVQEESGDHRHHHHDMRIVEIPPLMSSQTSGHLTQEEFFHSILFIIIIVIIFMLRNEREHVDDDDHVCVIMMLSHASEILRGQGQVHLLYLWYEDEKRRMMWGELRCCYTQWVTANDFLGVGSSSSSSFWEHLSLTPITHLGKMGTKTYLQMYISCYIHSTLSLFERSFWENISLVSLVCVETMGDLDFSFSLFFSDVTWLSIGSCLFFRWTESLAKEEKERNLLKVTVKKMTMLFCLFSPPVSLFCPLIIMRCDHWRWKSNERREDIFPDNCCCRCMMRICFDTFPWWAWWFENGWRMEKEKTQWQHINITMIRLDVVSFILLFLILTSSCGRSTSSKRRSHTKKNSSPVLFANNTDMSQDRKEFVLSSLLLLDSEYSDYDLTERCSFLISSFRQRYRGGDWQCVAGKNFISHTTAHANSYAEFTFNRIDYLLFKTCWWWSCHDVYFQ